MGFREARKKAGVSGVKAAYELGVSVTTVYGWERGIYTPTSKRLPEIAKVYKCSIEDLLGHGDCQQDSA